MHVFAPRPTIATVRRRQPSRIALSARRRAYSGSGSVPPVAPPCRRSRRGADAGGWGGTFGRAHKNVIYLWLQGGPPQHETFDPKPDATAEIRGEFKPIQTNVPGIQICELLPRIAGICDKLAIVRSICTHSDLHDASGYWILTGNQYAGQESRQISPSDWPYLGSIIKMLKPSEQLPAFSSVWLPDVMRLNDNVTPAGQTAGFLGKRWEPHRIVGDPSAPGYTVQGLALPPEIPPPAPFQAIACDSNWNATLALLSAEIGGSKTTTTSSTRRTDCSPRARRATPSSAPRAEAIAASATA